MIPKGHKEEICRCGAVATQFDINFRGFHCEECFQTPLAVMPEFITKRNIAWLNNWKQREELRTWVHTILPDDITPIETTEVGYAYHAYYYNVSFFLDCDQLATFTPNPYWEVYNGSEVKRFKKDNTEVMFNYIRTQIK